MSNIKEMKRDTLEYMKNSIEDDIVTAEHKANRLHNKLYTDYYTHKLKTMNKDLGEIEAEIVNREIVANN